MMSSIQSLKGFRMLSSLVLLVFLLFLLVFFHLIVLFLIVIFIILFAVQPQVVLDETGILQGTGRSAYSLKTFRLLTPHPPSHRRTRKTARQTPPARVLASGTKPRKPL